MKFTIEIGDIEKHRLEYTFNQLFGKLVIKINEQPVKQSVRWVMCRARGARFHGRAVRTIGSADRRNASLCWGIEPALRE